MDRIEVTSEEIQSYICKGDYKLGGVVEKIRLINELLELVEKFFVWGWISPSEYREVKSLLLEAKGHPFTKTIKQAKGG